MKICVAIRTYNEEKNIRQCCEAYQFADAILIADGGSEDNTVAIAKEYPKVKVREYLTKVKCQNGILRNPDGPHINFLLDWADEEGADWVIEQDCDQRPNFHLKKYIRGIMEETKNDYILVTQLFLWGKEHFFPELSAQPEWIQGLWAWRASTHLRVIDKMPHFEFTLDGVKSFDVNTSNKLERLLPPFCFMHFGWQTEEQVDAHLAYYRTSGLIPEMLHPKQFGGRIVPKPTWAEE